MDHENVPNERLGLWSCNRHSWRSKLLEERECSTTFQVKRGRIGVNQEKEMTITWNTPSSETPEWMCLESASAAWGSGTRHGGFTSGYSMKKTADRSSRKPSNWGSISSILLTSIPLARVRRSSDAL